MDKLFGSRARTDTLVATCRLGTTYVSEIAKILGRRPIEVQRAVASLELSSVVTTRRLGTLRIVELNRQFPEYPELAELLSKMSERPIYAELWKHSRKRPRALGNTIP